MSQSLSFFLESLQVHFLHIRTYDLPYSWNGTGKRLTHSVLWFVDDGTFSLEIDRVSFQAETGDLCLLPADSVISFKALSSRIRLISLNFDAVIPFLKDRSWVEFIRIPLHYRHIRPEIEPLLLEMLEYAERSTAGQNLLLQADLLRILFYMLQSKPLSMPEKEFHSIDNRILTIIHYITAQPEHLPAVEELADLIQISPSHLRKLFDDNLGLSPMTFIHEWKMEQAKKELASGKLRVSDVAYRLGFQEPNYFARLFKSKTGFTPRQYRKQFQIFDA